jgi:hypothetical protein
MLTFTSFVEGHYLFLFRRNDLALLLKTSDHPVDCILEILHIDGFLILTGCDQRRFVTDVGNFRSGKPRGLCRKLPGVDRRVKLDRLKVHFKDRLAADDIRLINTDLTVKTSWTQ